MKQVSIIGGNSYGLRALLIAAAAAAFGPSVAGLQSNGKRPAPALTRSNPWGKGGNRKGSYPGQTEAQANSLKAAAEARRDLRASKRHENAVRSTANNKAHDPNRAALNPFHIAS
jgi:hypothetical protein